MAALLARNVSTIARHPDAGRFLQDLKNIIDRIEHRINRPKPERFLGPCPTLIDRRQICATELRSTQEATQTTCPTCKQTHTIEHLEQELRKALREHPMSAVEILGSRTSDLPGALEELKLGTVRRTTFYKWCAKGKLQPRSYRTASGATMPYREDPDDKPLYWISDVEKLINEMTGKTFT